MTIPKKVKIGESEYSVKRTRFVGGKNWSGFINYHDRKIKIKPGYSEREEEDVFFHEIAHGILKEMEFNHPQINKFRGDEQFIQELGLLIRKTFKSLNEEKKP